MNKNILITTVAVVALLALAGCQSAPSETTKDNQANGENGINLTPPSEEVQKLLSLQDQLSQIVKAADVAKCQELSMEQYVKSCEVNILANKAASATDTAVCDAASSEEIKTQCQTLVAGKK